MNRRYGLWFVLVATGLALVTLARPAYPAEGIPGPLRQPIGAKVPKIWRARLPDAVGDAGHGRMACFLLGSIAQKVVSLAHCPVVVVR